MKTLVWSLVVFVAATLNVRAEAKVEEQDIGPVQSDAQYVVSPHGGHVATVTHKGSRMIVVYDGVAGPKFDDIRSCSSYVDLHPYENANPNDIPHNFLVTFSKDGSRYAYVGRAGQEFVVIADGKEVLRTTVEHPDQLDVRMQFTGDDGKHLLFAVSSFAEFELWVDGQKMPGTYNSGGGGSEGMTDPLVSADGARYAYVAQLSRDKRTVIVDGKDAGFVGDNLAFTADGKHLLACVHEGTSTWLAVDGKPKMKTDGISQLVMAPTGNGFAVVLQRLNPPGVFLVVNGKKIEGSDCPSINNVVFSPDGKHFAALCSVSPSVKFVLADGKKGEEYTDLPGNIPPARPFAGMRYSADSSKLGYVASTPRNKEFVVINDDESDGYDSNAGFAFSDDGKHFAYGGMVRQPMSFPVNVDGKMERPNGIPSFEMFAFSPDGNRHAYDVGGQGGALYIDGQPAGIVGSFLFSPDSKHIAISGRRGTDNKGGLFVDGKLVYEARSNFLIRHVAFTSDSQHLFWDAYEPPKDPTKSQGDFVTYLDGKPVAHCDNPYVVVAASIDAAPQPRDWITHKPAPSWQVGSDNVLTLVGPVGDVVKRYKVTPSSDTSINTLLGTPSAATTATQPTSTATSTGSTPVAQVTSNELDDAATKAKDTLDKAKATADAFKHLFGK